LSWVSPTGFEDPAGEWIDEELAYDEDVESRARTVVDPKDWGDFLYLTHPGMSSDRLRIMVWIHSRISSIDLDVLRGGVWVNVYQGAIVGGILDRVWVTKTFTEGVVTKARMRFYNSDASNNYFAHVREFDFWDTVLASSTQARLVGAVRSPYTVEARLVGAVSLPYSVEARHVGSVRSPYIVKAGNVGVVEAGMYPALINPLGLHHGHLHGPGGEDPIMSSRGPRGPSPRVYPPGLRHGRLHRPGEEDPVGAPGQDDRPPRLHPPGLKHGPLHTPGGEDPLEDS